MNLPDNCFLEKSYFKPSDEDKDEDGKCDKNILSRFRDADVWKPFLIVNLFFLLQIWSGMGTLTWFSISIIRSSGTRLDPSICSLMERLATILGQISASLVSLRFNRRTVFISTTAIFSLSWLGLGNIKCCSNDF